MSMRIGLISSFARNIYNFYLSLSLYISTVLVIIPFLTKFTSYYHLGVLAFSLDWAAIALTKSAGSPFGKIIGIIQQEYVPWRNFESNRFEEVPKTIIKPNSCFWCNDVSYNFLITRKASNFYLVRTYTELC